MFDLLEEIRKKTLSQIKIQLIFRNEAYIPQINDDFFEVFCAFKAEFTENLFIIPGLPPGVFNLITAKAINLLVKTCPFPGKCDSCYLVYLVLSSVI